MSQTPIPAGIEEAQAWLSAGHVDEVTLTQAYLAAIERVDGEVHSYLTVLADSALAEAQARRAERQRHQLRGPLHGVPIAIKDIVDVAGVRTTGGSASYDDEAAAQADAPVVTALRDAGAIILGKTATHELAIGGPRLQPPYPTGCNPWNTRYITGGSSSGSAAAVAAGLCAAAVGTDTGGSIRTPASFCGVTGLKPTWGAVTLDGVIPLIPSMDSAGPLTRSAADARLLFDAMVRPGADRAPRAPRAPLRVGVETGYYRAGVDARIVALVEAAASVIGDTGAVLVPQLELAVPEAPELLQVDMLRGCWRTFMAEAAAYHEARLARVPERFGRAREIIEEGGRRSAVDYVRALQQRAWLAAGFARLFLDCEVLLVPATPALPATFADALANPSAAPAALAMPANLAGLAALALPCGFIDGLPVGLQLVGPPGSEALLLAVGEAYQRQTAWHRLAPPASAWT